MIHRKGFSRWGLVAVAVLLLVSTHRIYQLHASPNPVPPVSCGKAGTAPCDAVLGIAAGARLNDVSTAGDARAGGAEHSPEAEVREREASLVKVSAGTQRETFQTRASKEQTARAREDSEPARGEKAQDKTEGKKTDERNNFTTAAVARLTSKKFDPDSSLKGAQAALGARLLAGSGSCLPSHHLVFLKVHKAASSTVANVIQRYGHHRHLNFVLPQKTINSPYYNYLSRPGEPLRASSIIPLTLRTRPKSWKAGEGGEKEYHLLWNHAIYDRPTMDLIMPAGTKYVAILREPFQRFVSALAYYRGFMNQNGTDPPQDPYPPPKWVLMRQARLSGQNSLKHRLQRQKAYKVPPDNLFSRYLHVEPQAKLMDYFRNGQCLDLGMSAEEVVQKPRRQQFLARLDRELDLVMITEFFDESLVLLRRLMCWEVKDVLYLPVNGNIRKPQVLFSRADFSRHQQLNQAEYDLYHFFRQKFLRILAAQDMNFAQEVQYFKSTLGAVSTYCSQSKQKARSKPKEEPVDSDAQRPPDVVGNEKTRDPEVERDLKTERDRQPQQDSKIQRSPKTERDLEVQEQNKAELNKAARRDDEAAGDLQTSADLGISEEAWTETKGSNANKDLKDEADDVLVIPLSPWGDEFTVSRDDCFMMQLPETKFLNILMSEAWGKIRQEIGK